MIRTVTLNPALDKTVEIEDFKVGCVNRVLSMRLDVGGKGINVSKMIGTLGGKSIAFGFLSGRNGDYIKNYLDRSGIENDFVFINGETRTNMKIIDSMQHTNTDINEPGPYVSQQKILELESKVFKGIDKNTVLVLSGSTPNSVPTDIYKKWVDRAKKFGARAILDCDGELLKEGIKVDVKSTVGAGDSMVAALAFAIDNGMDFERAAALSAASGTAKVTTSGSQPPELEKIMSIQSQVKFIYIK